MKKILVLMFITLCSLGVYSQRKMITEQETKSEVKDFIYPRPVKKDRYKIAVLTPMYLDSIDLDKNMAHLPKFMMPGIDFYQGVRIAADTLKKMGFKLDIFVYDSKSFYLDVKNLIESDKLDSIDLIIGNASVSDLKLLGDFAKKRQINFVSAVSPSDAGQTLNPYFTILQPRLASHIEMMHKHINRKYPEDNVVYVSRKSQAEQNGLNYFKNDLLNSLPGRFKEIELKGDEIQMNEIIKKIDTSYNTTIFLGILDPLITYKNLKILSEYAKRYRLKVYCMPTTEAVKSLNKTDEFPNMPVYYTTSYIIDKITPASQYISKEYKSHMGTAPSDVVYKGFESLFFFSNLLKKFGVPFNSKIGDNSYTFITPYKIVPVKENGSLMFYENKFLYLLRYEDGIMIYE
ncbi:MAG: hypothetical protein KA198_01115 [Chitinophagaceae bacterium]|nr:hypothetical protein [Chitinophagaceae bacterium]